MPQFSDEYFRDLPPRDRRYDTPVADQLVFSVFPNGVKAWVHVYPCDEYVRRRTLGLFPEMGLAAARAALEQSRRIAEVDAQQVRGGRPARKVPTRMLLTAVVAAAVGSIATYLIVSPSAPPGQPASSGEQRVAMEAATGESEGIPVEAGAGTDGAPAHTGLAVFRAVLTSGIEDREPTDRLAGPLELPGAGQLTVFFFTELRGMSGHTVSHRWSRRGETVGELPFDVGEESGWSVYSSKDIGLEDVGAWSVQVIDEQGRVLESVEFIVRAPS